MHVECEQHTPETQTPNVYEIRCDVIYIKPNYVCASCGTTSCNLPQLGLGGYFIIAGGDVIILLLPSSSCRFCVMGIIKETK